VVWMKCASCSFSSALSVLASWYIQYSCFHKNCIDMHNCTKIKWEDLKFWRSVSGVWCLIHMGELPIELEVDDHAIE
jgi:hypothetical protein